ncbi:Ankyrin-3 [Lasiodiplodia theobromae]|nr:Ankyrin-3 [Lasiodiplodia theobromae]
MTLPPPYHEIQYSIRSYTVGWFAPLPCERAAAEALRDEVHVPPKDFHQAPDDHLVYSWGKIGDHNVVLASLEAGTDGLAAAAQAATRMLASFSGIRFGLLVGIGGAIPRFDKREGGGVFCQQLLRPDDPDVRLGDVVVSQPDGNSGGVIQYDHYKATKDGPQVKGSLNRPPPALLYGLAALQAKHEQSPSDVPNIIADLEKTNDYMVNERGYKHPGQKKDRLFYPSCAHPKGDLDCEDCSAQHEVQRKPRKSSDPEVHYGTIASGNVVVKDAEDRENLIKHHPSASKCLCYEMEAAGVMNNFPCLVIRGICDYSDSHKNDVWHNYAALVAAAFAKELLRNMARDAVEKAVIAKDWMKDRVNIIAYHTMKNEIERTLKTTNTYSKGAEIQSTLQSVNLDIKEAGQWFLDSSEFQQWGNSLGSLLWVYGMPGSGKTVLSASVINYLQSNLAAKNASKVVLHYYFDIQESKKGENMRPLGCMLRSFLIQLSKTHDYMLEDLYKRLGAFQGELCESELGELLFQMTRLHCDIKIVIDALDEMEDRQRETVCGWITKTLKLHPTRFSFLVTSRRERDIEEQLYRKCESLKFVEMSAGFDIEKYVLARITGYQLNKGQRWSEESLRKIQDVLLRRANGMFQWVVCQLDQLLDHPQTESFGDDEIDEVLRTLPKDLTDTYDRILDRIPKPRKNAAYRLLQILLFCKRPICVLEANEFLSVQCSGFNVSKRIKYPCEVTRYCSSLITLRGPHSENRVTKWTEIVLAHSSVRDYLLFNRTLWKGQVDIFGQLEANKAIFKTCLQYIHFLSMPDADPYGQDLGNRFPLANYATRYLFEHASAAGTEEETVNAVIAFYRSGDAFRTWLCHESTETAREFYLKGVNWHASMEIVKQSALYTAARYGLKYYLQICLERESYRVCEAKTFNPLGFWTTFLGIHQSISPLYAAAEVGRKDVVRMLIEAGFAVDEVGGPQGTALDVGCANGCVGVVEALLEKAKQRSTSTMWFEGALRQAVRTGSLQLVQVFLDHGFLTHSAQPSIESAIFDAALCGNTAIAKELLRRCRGLRNLTDLSLPLSPTNTPPFFGRLSAWVPYVFSWSGGSSHEHIATQSPLESHDGALDAASLYDRLSIPSGGSVDRGHLFSTALQAAAFEGHEEIVEALLEEGRDPNVTGGYFGTAIQAAAAGGFPWLVQRLLDAGADPNITGGFFKTALNASLMMESWIIKGWDMKWRAFGGTYRFNRVWSDFETAVMLLKAGAQPLRGGEEMVCALKLESQEVALNIIENAASGAGQTEGYFHTVATLLCGKDVADSALLHEAISRGFSKVVESMIRNGAAIDVLDSCGRTPLHNAMRQNNQDIALMVIQTVAQTPDAVGLLKARDSSGMIAVHYAAQLPVSPEAMKHLLGAAEQAGILIEYLDARSGSGQTALHYAIQQNQDIASVIIQAAARRSDLVSLLKAKNSSGMTAVHYAAQKTASSETMKHLLSAAKQAGILTECLNAQSNDGRTALHYAPHSTFDKTSRIVELLIDAASSAGILVDYANAQDDRGETALHRAARCHDVRGVALLLRAGADEGAMNLDKQSFVDCAREGGRVGRLVDVCPEATFCSSMEEARAIASAVLLHQFVELNDVAAVKEIAGKATFHSSFLDIPDADHSMTLLHHAAEKSYTPMGELLLDLGAQPEGVDKEKMTPLHRAAKSGCLEMVTAILQRIGNEDKENRPLFSVADFREDDFNGFLTGKPSDRQDTSGSTPLHYAVQNESVEMVKSLAHCGATMHRRNKEGNTPLDLAQEKREAFYVAKIHMPRDIAAVNLIARFLEEEDEKYDGDY